MKYEFFNPNPKQRYKKDGTPMGWHRGDCTTRALSKALDLSWKDTFKLQCDEGMKRCAETDSPEVVESILLNNGFTADKIDEAWIKKHHRRPKVSELVDDLYGHEGNKKIVIKCTHHVVAAEGETIYDVWDTSDEVVWKFWYK